MSNLGSGGVGGGERPIATVPGTNYGVFGRQGLLILTPVDPVDPAEALTNAPIVVPLGMKNGEVRLSRDGLATKDVAVGGHLRCEGGATFPSITFEINADGLVRNQTFSLRQDGSFSTGEGITVDGTLVVNGPVNVEGGAVLTLRRRDTGASVHINAAMIDDLQRGDVKHELKVKGANIEGPFRCGRATFVSPQGKEFIAAPGNNGHLSLSGPIDLLGASSGVSLGVDEIGDTLTISGRTLADVHSQMRVPSDPGTKPTVRLVSHTEAISELLLRVEQLENRVRELESSR